jgi:hypothetical protein
VRRTEAAGSHRLASQRADDAVDLSIEQNAELLQFGAAERREKERGSVIGDSATFFAHVEQSNAEWHVETRADVDGR